MKYIILGTGNGITWVSDIDFDFLSSWRWYYVQNKRCAYACKAETINGRQKRTFIHNLIAEKMGLNTCLYEIDHRDLNGLNNQRENLREATPSQNSANTRLQINSTTGYKGVHKYHEKYRVRIRVNRKLIHLGIFATAIEAAKAYDKAAKYYFKDFAYLNFPEK